jgi:eukaryotic-like serine/threonine-protein kinase
MARRGGSGVNAVSAGAGQAHDPPERVGAFVIREEIAAGSFGAVFRAEHAESGAPAAVKIMHAELAASAEAVARFTLEIAAMQRVGHPGVLAVIDSGRLPDGRLYLVTELLAGESLEARLAARGRLDPGEILEILEPVCAALAAAHARGIVHRDVKASNIFLAEQGSGAERRVVLLDFGVAKLLDGGSALTTTGDLVGTLACMSPEQILNRPVDPRTDVYALGVLAFRMLTGSPPFVAKHPIALQQMHLFTAPRRPSAIAPVDPALDAPVLHALAKAPEGRPEGVEAFLSELRGAAGGTQR